MKPESYEAGRVASGWWLDRALVYAITAPKRLPPRLAEGGVCDAHALGSTESIELATLNLHQLAQLTGTSELDLSLLADCGLLQLTGPDGTPCNFSVALLPVLLRARQLREDLALNVDEWALATYLLLEIEKTEAKLRLLRPG